jgi:hypothetical protein
LPYYSVFKLFFGVGRKNMWGKTKKIVLFLRLAHFFLELVTYVTVKKAAGSEKWTTAHEELTSQVLLMSVIRMHTILAMV